MDKFRARLTGQINGEDLLLHGEGQRDSHAGLVQGIYRPVPVISGFDEALVNAFIITGYPSECAARVDVENPFRNRAYRYARRLRMCSGSTLDLTADCRFVIEGGDVVLESDFHVTGEANVPPLVSVDPLIETWVPRDEQHVDGTFTMVWVTESGTRIYGTAETHYEILEPVDQRLLRSVHRFIAIDFKVDGESIRRRQESHIFTG